MQRKIVKHGKSTLSVSLPSKYVQANNLKNGQLMNIEVSRGKLILSAKEKHFDKIETDLTESEEWPIVRILRHLYTAGYDEIDVKYTQQKLPLIRKSLHHITGLEIVEVSPTHCKLKCMSSLDENEYDSLIKRIMWMVLSEFDRFLEDIAEGTLATDEVQEILNTVSRLCNLCKRIINKKSIYDSTDSIYAYDFIDSMIEMSVLVLYAYDYLKKNKNIKLTEKEVAFIKQTRDYFYDLILAYQNTNLEKTRTFFEQRKETFDGFLELLNGKNPVIMHYFLMILRNLTPVGNHIIMLGLRKKDKQQ